MAVKLAKKNNQFNMQVRTFYIDSVDDLAVIETQYDCGIGDRAELPDGTVYCRHSDGYTGDLWAVRSSGSKPSPSPSPSPSGGDLPTATEDDIGKYLRVQGVPSGVSTVIVPEQTVTVSQEQPTALLEDADDSLFVVGTEVLIRINDNEYVGHIATLDDEGVVGWMDSSVGAIGYMEGQSGSEVVFMGTDAGEYTVSMGTVNYEPSWAKTDPDYKVTTENVVLIPPTEMSAIDENDGIYYGMVGDFDSIDGALIDDGIWATVTFSDAPSEPYIMPIRTYVNDENDHYVDWVIGDYLPTQGPSFENYPIALRYNQYAKELLIYSPEAISNITVQASYTQSTADMSDDFIIASQAADNTIIVCPKQTVTLVDGEWEVKLTYASDLDMSIFANLSRALPRTKVKVNGIELPFDIDNGEWRTEVTQGTDYVVYFNDAGGSFYFYCAQYEIGSIGNETIVPGDYEVSVQTTRYTEPQLPDYLIVRMMWTKGDISCNYTYDELVNALNDNIPLIAYINQQPCVRAPYNSLGYDGEVLKFQIMERSPLDGSSDAILTIGEFSISSDSGVDSYNWQEWKYHLTAEELLIDV